MSEDNNNNNQNDSVNDNGEFEKIDRNRLRGNIGEDEEENAANNEQPEEQEVENETKQDDKLNAQDMQQIAKSGASLAKNAATGNVVGAAKDALNLAKNKKVRNKMIRHAIIQFAGPFLLILFLAAAIFGIFGAVADTVGEVLGGIGQAIVDFFTVDESDGAIIISDEQIDTIINSIEEQGISTEDLKLLGDYEENASEAEKQRAVRKYIRKFYEAQALTETLNYYHYDSTNDTTFGAIYVYRANGDVNEDISNREEITYISYDKMQEMIANNNIEAAKHFSIDDSENLVVASYSETIVQNSNGQDNSHTYTVSSRTINYKSLVSQYTTKMNFLIDLTLISQNPEFVSAVVDLIKDSRIEITIMDNTTTNVKTVTNSYTLNVHVEADRGATPGTSGSYYNVDDSYERTSSTTTTTITRTPSIQINYVKTWFCEQRKNYTKDIDGPNEISNVTTHPADEAQPEGDGSWKTNQTTTTVETSTTESYKDVGSGEGLVFTLGEQGDGERYENGEIDEPTFVGLMETEYRIPYSTREEAAGTNLISGAEMLFYLLQKDPDLENMEIIMRYAFNQYLGYEKYEVTLDGSIFEIKDFVPLNSSGSSDDLLLEYIGYWESGPNGPKKNADGTKYIIIDDGVGNLAVGHGVDIYNSGMAYKFIEAGYTIAEGAEVDIEFVDAIKLEILQRNKNDVNALGLDLTGYQFNALVSFCYNCGSASGFKTAYNAYWNQERDDKFEEKDPNADLTHQLYTQYFSQYIHAGDQVLQGLIRRRRSEWTLFQTGYYDVLNKWHPDSGDLTGDSQIEDGYFAYPCPGHTWSTYSGHEGIDISWPGCEGEPVYAAQAGTVSLVQTGHVNNQGSSGMASYGNCVFIQHENGWESRYAHMTSVVVSQGEHVEQGQLLGYIGNTGNSYGAHLHISLYDPSGNEGSGSRNWAEIAWPQYRG